MKLNRWMALIFMTSLGAALVVWNHGETRDYKSINAAPIQLLRDEDTGVILTGTLFPMITTPIVGRNLNLAVPLNVWVKQGEVIGTAASASRSRGQRARLAGTGGGPVRGTKSGRRDSRGRRRTIYAADAS